MACNSPVKKSIADKSDTVNLKNAELEIGQPVDDSSYSTKKQNSTTQQITQKNTKIYFPHFTVKVYDFRVYSNINGLGELSYNGDTSEVKLNIDEKNIWAVIAKKDTLHLSEDPDNYFRNNLLEITPENRNDSFRLSYMFQIDLKERTDSTSITRWNGTTRYKYINDSLSHFFRVPVNVYNDSGKNEIKNRLKLKDTLVKYPGEFEEEATVVYERKPYVFTANYICLRIERFVGDKLAETKFITFAFDYTG